MPGQINKTLLRILLPFVLLLLLCNGCLLADGEHEEPILTMPTPQQKNEIERAVEAFKEEIRQTFSDEVEDLIDLYQESEEDWYNRKKWEKFQNALQKLAVEAMPVMTAGAQQVIDLVDKYYFPKVSHANWPKPEVKFLGGNLGAATVSKDSVGVKVSIHIDPTTALMSPDYLAAIKLHEYTHYVQSQRPQGYCMAVIVDKDGNEVPPGTKGLMEGQRHAMDEVEACDAMLAADDRYDLLSPSERVHVEEYKKTFRDRLTDENKRHADNKEYDRVVTSAVVYYVPYVSVGSGPQCDCLIPAKLTTGTWEERATRVEMLADWQSLPDELEEKDLYPQYCFLGTRLLAAFTDLQYNCDHKICIIDGERFNCTSELRVVYPLRKFFTGYDAATCFTHIYYSGKAFFFCDCIKNPYRAVDRFSPEGTKEWLRSSWTLDVNVSFSSDDQCACFDEAGLNWGLSPLVLDLTAVGNGYIWDLWCRVKPPEFSCLFSSPAHRPDLVPDKMVLNGIALTGSVGDFKAACENTPCEYEGLPSECVFSIEPNLPLVLKRNPDNSFGPLNIEFRCSCAEKASGDDEPKPKPGPDPGPSAPADPASAPPPVATSGSTSQAATTAAPSGQTSLPNDVHFIYVITSSDGHSKLGRYTIGSLKYGQRYGLPMPSGLGGGEIPDRPPEEGEPTIEFVLQSDGTIVIKLTGGKDVTVRITGIQWTIDNEPWGPVYTEPPGGCLTARPGKQVTRSLPVPSVPVPTAGPPTPPSNVTAVPRSSSSVSITWQASSSSVTGYEIQRRIAGTGAYTPVTTVGPSTTTFTDTGLSADTAYEYQVLSFKDDVYSDPSLPVTVHTQVEYVAKVSTDKAAYNLGEMITIHYSVSHPATVFLIDHPADGESTQFWTSSVGAGSYQLPIPKSGQHIMITEPMGIETVELVATFPSGESISTDVSFEVTTDIPEDVLDAAKTLAREVGREAKIEGWRWKSPPDCITDCCSKCMWDDAKLWMRSSEASASMNRLGRKLYTYRSRASEAGERYLAKVYAEYFWKGYYGRH